MNRDVGGYLDLSDEVLGAFSESRAVLALESTIITHGMPWPQNLEAAKSVQQCVRENGAVPATIAIMDGQLKVGLSDQELERLAKTGQSAAKCSRRDIPFVLNAGSVGATTVAATMIIADMAGIPVFATGGIGGVHRGAQNSMDVSADLQELAGTPVAVVCAGPKAILDIGMTLEYLETCGVPVIGYGCERLPAFYTRESVFKVDYRLDSAKAIAEVLNTKWSLGLDGGVVIANPIPEEFALDSTMTEQYVAESIEQALEGGIRGKNLTPWLLQRVEQLTAGKSLESNIELMLNNARLGAEIAVAFTNMTKP
jgi:pseudouridine-5'-phosphate glycosidase